jgi:hypothetical protein
MARGNTVYLKSESGRVESFDQFRQRLKKLGTSETLRFRELRNVLKTEARPLVEKARKEAYNELQGKASYKARGVKDANKKTNGAFYNLYKTIDVFANKGTVKAYVVVGLRKVKKQGGGAYYAPWQLFGGTAKNFTPKEFFDKALQGSDVPRRAAEKISNFVQKRIKAHLR